MPKTSSTTQRILDRRKQIINLIKDHGVLSKNDIFKMTKYSISTVISTVDDLNRDGLIEPCGSNPAAIGRPALYYSLKADYGYSIGIDINSDCVNIAIINFKRKTVKTLHKRILPEVSSLREIISQIPVMVDELLASYETAPRLICIGVAAPGLINVEEGSIIYYSRFSNERDIPVTSFLSEYYNCPVYIDKSLNCLATAYKEQESGRPLDNMILFSIRTGVGMSCILNGNIYRGATGQAGEIGHIRVPNSTALCKCKKIGCLDAEVSIYSITKKMDAILGPLNDENGMPMTTAKKIELFVHLVKGNQPDCIHILDEMCYFFSYAVNQVINLFDPSDILLYGEVTQCGSIFIDHLKNYLDKSTLNPCSHSIHLAVADLSAFAFAEGAAYYALDQVFQPASTYAPAL